MSKNIALSQVIAEILKIQNKLKN